MKKYTKKCFYLLPFILLAFSVLSCTNCKNGEVKDKRFIYIDSIMKSTYNKAIPHHIKNIFIINDNNGSCGKCVKSYSEFVKKHIADCNSIIIINSADGINIDKIFFDSISFKSKNNNLILNRKEITWNRLNPFSMLTYIKIKQKKVDTLFYLDYPIDRFYSVIDSLNAHN